MTDHVRLPSDPVEMARVLQESLNAIQTDVKGVKGMGEDTKANIAKAFALHEELNKNVADKFAAKQKAEDELSTKLVEAEKSIAAFKKDTDEYQKRLKDIELIMAQKASTGADPELARKTPEYKAMWDYLCKGQTPSGGAYAFRSDVEIKTMRTDSDVQGGYLVPLVTDNEIRKNITEMSPVRMFARVRQASSKTIEIPRRLSIPTAAYEGEGETSPTDQSTYGNEQVTLFRQTVTIPATLDMMVSSAFNLEQEIAMDVGEAFGKGEGSNFVSGTGIKSPQGFIKDTRPEVVPTGTAGSIDWSDMINIASKLKRGQNPWYFLNRRTLGYLQGIKSTIGVPIWSPVAGDKPATIWGFPYNSDMIDLADAQTGTGAKPIAFADLRRGYEIYDLIGISVIRDDLTRKKESITEWTFRRYNTGRVVIPEAIKIMQIA